MKKYAGVAVILGAVILGTGCATPPNDAVAGPYREPRGPRSGYEGLVNTRQTQHLLRGTFPRLTDTEWLALRRINREVNRDIVYLSDLDNYGVADRPVTEPSVRRPLARNWRPARYGDCEDYALTKKHRLARAGLSASRLFVLLVEVPDRHGLSRHSVLAVPEGSEWWILNNWHNEIERASTLERWWGWRFIRPRYDYYLLSMQKQPRAPGDLVATGSSAAAGAPARR